MTEPGEVSTGRTRLAGTQQLTERIGTTASVISRIESGQHRTSAETLRRPGEALGGQALGGFAFEDEPEVAREIVAL